MGFKAVRKAVIEALEDGRYSHEPRDLIDEKNLLYTGAVSAAEVVALLKSCRGGQHECSPHHANRSRLVHVFKPADRAGVWYIKCYVVEVEGVEAMRLYQAGDRSAAVCEHCKADVATRMEYRDYTPPGWEVEVPDVLVGVCERCGRVIAIPHQSTAKINERRKRTGDEIKVVDCRISRADDEALGLVAATLGGDRSVMRPAIYRYYVSKVAEQPGLAEAIKRLDESASDEGVGLKYSIKFRRRDWESALAAAKAAGISSASDLVRGLNKLLRHDFSIVGARGRPVPGEAGAKKEAKARVEALKALAKGAL